MRLGTAILAIAALSLGSLACQEEKPRLVDPATQPPQEGGAEPQVLYRIGDTVALGEWEHTLHGARWSTGTEFIKPPEGTYWLVLDIEVTNAGDEPAAVSSIVQWRLLDGENRSANQTLTGDTQGQLDGELGPGRSLRGEIAYAVSSQNGPWELVFDPSLLGSGQAVYSIRNDDVENTPASGGSGRTETPSAGTPTVRETPVGGTSPPPSSGEDTPEDTVRTFYEAIGQGRFDLAFAQLSTRRASPSTVEQFAAGYTTTDSVVVEYLSGLPGSENVVQVTILARDIVAGQMVETRYTGTWTLVRESGEWKLDLSNIQQVP
jgi:uncharacterized protein DUF4352